MKSLKLLELKVLILEPEFIPSGIKGFKHEARFLMDIKVAQRKHGGSITISPRRLNTL